MSTLKTNNIQHVDRSEPSILINTDGSVNIAGTMTYEDVTSVDAVGIITGREIINAQKQVHVGTGVSVKAGGLNVTAGITTVQALQATTGNFSSNVDVAGEFTVAETIAHTGDTNNKISFPAADTITLTTAGSEALRVDSSGVVRIGGVTSAYNASDKLTLVNNSGNCSLTIDSTSSSESSVFFADGATGTEAYRGYIQYKHSLDSLVFGSGGSEFMRARAWGDVNISNKLNVTGIVTASNFTSSGTVLIDTTSYSEATTDADDIIIGSTSDTQKGISIVGSTSGGIGNIYFTDGVGYKNQGRISYHHADDSLRFSSNVTERLRIDSSGRILVGTTAYKSNLNSSFDAGGQVAQFVGKGDNVSHCVGIFAYSGTTNGLARGAKLQFNRSRATDGSTNTAVVEDDLIGAIDFKGNDGTNFTTAASIEASCAGVPGTDDMPGQLRFSTTADGAASPTKRLDLDKDGSALFYHAGTNHLTVSGQSFCNGVGAGPSPASVVLAVGRDSGSARSAHFAGHLQFAGGYGIDFSPTSDLSGSTSEVLDNYEEGTWTPTVNNGFSGISYVIQRGWYVRIGDLIHVSFFLRFNATGASTHMKFSGLPIVAANLSPAYSSGGNVTFTNIPGIDSSSNAGNQSIWLGGNSSIFELFSNGNSSSATGSGGFSNKEIYGVITYRVA